MPRQTELDSREPSVARASTKVTDESLLVLNRQGEFVPLVYSDKREAAAKSVEGLYRDHFGDHAAVISQHERITREFGLTTEEWNGALREAQQRYYEPSLAEIREELGKDKIKVPEDELLTDYRNALQEQSDFSTVPEEVRRAAISVMIANNGGGRNDVDDGFDPEDHLDDEEFDQGMQTTTRDAGILVTQTISEAHENGGLRTGKDQKTVVAGETNEAVTKPTDNEMKSALAARSALEAERQSILAEAQTPHEAELDGALKSYINGRADAYNNIRNALADSSTFELPSVIEPEEIAVIAPELGIDNGQQSLALGF